MLQSITFLDSEWSGLSVFKYRRFIELIAGELTVLPTANGIVYIF